jgi:hypothetical protein
LVQFPFPNPIENVTSQTAISTVSVTALRVVDVACLLGDPLLLLLLLLGAFLVAVPLLLLLEPPLLLLLEPPLLLAGADLFLAAVIQIRQQTHWGDHRSVTTVLRQNLQYNLHATHKDCIGHLTARYL